jgi:hypothetical protein
MLALPFSVVRLLFPLLLSLVHGVPSHCALRASAVSARRCNPPREQQFKGEGRTVDGFARGNAHALCAIFLRSQFASSTHRSAADFTARFSSLLFPAPG